MVPKILNWVGLIACVTLIVACFMPWSYFADNNISLEAERTFTGFFSYQNHYGRPGILLVPLAILVITFMLIQRLWAKRINLFISALIVAFAISKYTQFSSCYNAYCPDKRIGIYLMLVSSFIILIAAIFSQLSIKKSR